MLKVSSHPKNQPSQEAAIPRSSHPKKQPRQLNIRLSLESYYYKKIFFLPGHIIMENFITDELKPIAEKEVLKTIKICQEKS